MFMRQASSAYKYLRTQGAVVKVLALSVILFGIVPSCSAYAQSPVGDSIEFNIPAQPVSSALRAYAHQAEVQLLLMTEGLEAVRSNTVIGSYSPADALQALLAGTGLDVQHEHPSIITVKRKSHPALSFRSPDSASPKMFLPLETVARFDKQRAVDDVGEADVESKTGFTRDAKLEEIVVTGSRIRGAFSASPVVIIGREEIDRTGYATVTEILQQLPQNFAGGPNEDTAATASANFTFGSAVNLRGLGTGSTLVLVNGRRQAPSGRDGGFVDISSLPLAAVERIEVLTDGASAIYGADAVGGVVNIILRKDFQRAETRFRVSPDTGNDREAFQLGHVHGFNWSTGNALAAYEYSRRGALSNEDRPYLESSDLTRFGGDDFRDTRSQPGNILNILTGGRLAIPQGQDGTSLEFEDLLTTGVNLSNQFAGRQVLPEQNQHSAFLTVNQELGSRLTAFAEMRYRQREFEISSSPIRSLLVVPLSNPFIDEGLLEAIYGIPSSSLPFLFVEYSFADDLGPLVGTGKATSFEGVLGGSARFGSTWSIDAHVSSGTVEDEALLLNLVNSSALNASLADSEPLTAFNPFGDGSNTNPATLDAVRTFNLQNMESRLKSAGVAAQGSVMPFRGGHVKLAFGADYREQDLSFGVLSPPMDTSGSDRDLGRDVTAAFAELSIPLANPATTGYFPGQLDLSVAARYERYRDFGSTTNPKVGLLWSPTPGITARATFGRSFRAPSLEDLRPLEQAAILVLDDPDAPTGQTRTLVRTGNNPDLMEETADIWTFGLDIRPQAIQQLAISMNYFDVEYVDRISKPDSFRNVHQERFAGIVNHDPTQEELDAICLSPAFLGDAAECIVELVEAIGDARLRNVAVTSVTGLDVSTSYYLDTAYGRWTLGIDGTRYFEYAEAFSATAPAFDIDDTIGNPIDLRARGRAAWSYRDFGVSLFVNYADSYVDNVSEPERRIDAYTTADLQLRYGAESGRDDTDDRWSFALSILNLLNVDPPFASTPFGGYDSANADPTRRHVALQIRKSW